MAQLRLDGNPLIGPLSNYIPINGIQSSNITTLISFSNTNLCIPHDEVYQDWLQMLDSVESNGIICTPPSLITTNGGQITSTDGRLQLSFPGDAVSETTTISLTTLITVSSSITSPQAVNYIFQLKTAPNLFLFQHPFTIQYSISSLQSKQGQKAIYIYQWDGLTWRNEHLTLINRTDSSITVQANSPGLFVVVGGETFYDFIPIVIR